MSDIITTDDILGKDVIDARGDILGVVQKIHVNKRTKEFVGITIDEGFMKPQLYVGIDHVKTFGVDTVILNTVPTDRLRGMSVFSGEMRLLGTVTDVTTEAATSKIASIIVKSGIRTQEIPAAKIKRIDMNILLK